MELCSKSSDENGWGTSGGGGLRVRVHLPATGRWLAVLHGGRLGFTRDHDRNLQHFTLKPQPGSNRHEIKPFLPSFVFCKGALTGVARFS
jgi:hypothetical protein